MSISMACPRCKHVHAADDVRAVGRFGDVAGYQALGVPDAPIRASREEAHVDVCARRLAARPTEIVPLRERAEVVTTVPKPEPLPFPAAAFETLARASAWSDFLTHVRFSLEVWQLDDVVRGECENVIDWIGRCRDELTEIGREKAAA